MDGLLALTSLTPVKCLAEKFEWSSRAMSDCIENTAEQRPYLIASIRLWDGKKISAAIIELRSDGCIVRSRRTIPTGEIVELIIPGKVAFTASVSRSALGRASLEFMSIAELCSDPDDAEDGAFASAR